MMRIVLSALIIYSLSQILLAECNNDCTTKVLDELQSPLFGTASFSYFRASYARAVGSNHPHIKRAVITIHGADRDAGKYFCVTEDALKRTNEVVEDTYILSPLFRTEDDYKRGSLYWSSNYQWLAGEPSAAEGGVKVSSFTVLDEILKIFLTESYYPNLKELVIAGHSGGAQAIHRYALGTSKDRNSNIPIRYVIANSPSYVYFNTLRPVLYIPTCSNYCNDSIYTANYQFVPYSFNVPWCKEYNTWKYGLVDLNEYMNVTANKGDMVSAYIGKNITYLLGQNDTCNQQYACETCKGKTEETGCEPEMQGRCRYQRGRIYVQYLQKF